MDDELASAALVEMPPERAAAVLGHIEPDEAADMLADLPDEVVEEILARLPVEHAMALRGLASHPEHSAGALMTTDVMACRAGLTPPRPWCASANGSRAPPPWRPSAWSTTGAGCSAPGPARACAGAARSGACDAHGAGLAPRHRRHRRGRGRPAHDQVRPAGPAGGRRRAAPDRHRDARRRARRHPAGRLDQAPAAPLPLGWGGRRPGWVVAGQAGVVAG